MKNIRAEVIALNGCKCELPVNKVAVLDSLFRTESRLQLLRIAISSTVNPKAKRKISFFVDWIDFFPEIVDLNTDRKYDQT